METLIQTAPDSAKTSPAPTTIAQAFEQWLILESAILAALEADLPCADDTARQWSIESLAVTLPAVTAQDVWQLVRMTSDEDNVVPRLTQDRLVSRAYCEVHGQAH